MLKQGKANPRGPLYQRLMGVEMEEVSITPSGTDAEDVLEGLLVIGSSGKRFDHLDRGVSQVDKLG